MENYINELKLKGFSPKTIKSYKYHTERFLKEIGKSRHLITKQDVKTYLLKRIKDNFP